MEFILAEHRHGLTMLKNHEIEAEWADILSVLGSISDKDILERHKKDFFKQKSISKALNILMKERFEKLDWNSESLIFSDPEFKKGKAFRLDFAKKTYLY